MFLTKVQIENEISQLLSKENGLRELMTITLNSLMKCERDTFLQSSTQSSNKGNGYRPVKSHTAYGELQLKVPRDRFGIFQPILLASLREQESLIDELCSELYCKGLTTRQIGEIIQKIYGKNYNANQISSINKSLYEEMENWRNRPLEKHYSVLYIDAIQVKLRRECVDCEAFYIIMGLNEEYKREILAIKTIPTESASGWQETLQEIKGRGVSRVDLIIADGLCGLEKTVKQVYPKCKFQRCVVHFERNVLNHVKTMHKTEVSSDLKDVFAVTKQDDNKNRGMQRMLAFCDKWRKLYPYIGNLIKKEDLENLFTFKDYCFEIRNMIYTTNWIERLNKDFRRTLKIRNSFPNEESVLFLLTSVSVEKQRNVFSFPIFNFKFEPSFK